ncbi:MAG: sugar kinase [Planctomycetes bacterium]|nr:sugar kinase [Planctomycetota bacterium]
MATLTIKPKDSCRWDQVSLGEIMLRLDPGEGRIRTARSFTVWEGGGEYNVARGLKKCFGLRTAVVTSIVDNDVGHLLEDLMMQGGVDLSHVKWVPFDGIGRGARVGLNFTERGFGLRAALGISDRAHSAASLLKRGDIDWNKIFKTEGARWFHCGGIYAALSETTPDLMIEAMECAKANGTVISYDLNYRPSLWKSVGGPTKAVEVNRRIASLVDVMLGNEEDFTASLGFQVEGESHLTEVDTANFQKMISQVVKAYPNFKVVATTLRNARTATVNDWSAVMWYDGAFHASTERKGLEILDRVGGGDSFASGLVYGFLAGKTPRECVEYGAAHGALAMTTPGDTSMVTLAEVEKVMKAKGARVER